MKYYVYELIDPRDNKVFYVGKGTGNRGKAHYYIVKNGNLKNVHNWSLYRKIKSILNEDMKICCNKRYFTNNEEDAYRFESDLINFYGIELLANISTKKGGGYPRISENHWNYGNHGSDDVKKKIGKSKKGQMHTENSKKKMSKSNAGKNNSMYGKSHSASTKRKMSENHQNFSGKNNPFYGKSHSKKIRERLKILYANEGKVTLLTGKEYLFCGKSEVHQFVKEYNKMNNTKISSHSMFQYGKNGDGGTVIKMGKWGK